MVVENKPGAGGNIGAAEVARAAADGYTFLVAAQAILVVNPLMYSTLPYDATRDLEPDGLLGVLPVVLVVHPDLPARNVGEFLSLARAKPGSLSYASAGVGTPHHLAAELFKSMIQTSLLHVPYKGGAPAANDLLAGRVQVMFAPMNNVIAYVRTDRLRILAVGTEERLKDLPDVSTIAEAGVPGYVVDNWIGIAAPAGTPTDVVRRMNAALDQVLSQAEVRAKISAQGIEPVAATPERMERMIKADRERWSAVIHKTGIKAD